VIVVPLSEHNHVHNRNGFTIDFPRCTIHNTCIRRIPLCDRCDDNFYGACQYCGRINLTAPYDNKGEKDRETSGARGVPTCKIIQLVAHADMPAASHFGLDGLCILYIMYV